MKTLLKTVNENPYITQGIFSKMANLGYFTWLTSDTALILDAEYYLQHSGEKFISPLYEKMNDIHDDDISFDVLGHLAQIIHLKYGNKWDRLYSAFVTATYNPIENYSMEENEKTNSKLKVTSKGSNGTYGFNSETAVPTDETDTESTSEGSEDDNHRTLTRSGNIGVTTSQKMLQSEIDLREWNFYHQMMNDVDEILTLRVYGGGF